MPRVTIGTKGLVDERYPVTKLLAQVFGGAAKSALRRSQLRNANAVSSTARHDIVSEQLCDDVLNYLAPTLEQHRGCTLIDVHPGACVWSSKIHDFLKPRRHILMEPEQAYYEPFIKPLLEKPGSAYVHSPLSGAHPNTYWNSYNMLMEDHILPMPMSGLAHDDPLRMQLNPNFLCIGNLARKYRAWRSANSVSWEVMIVRHMADAALTGELFHKSGLVRMLWWMPEERNRYLFAYDGKRRTSFTVGLDLCGSLTEAVGTKPLKDVVDARRKFRSMIGRPLELEGASADRAKSSMAKLGVSLAPNSERKFVGAAGAGLKPLRSPFQDLPTTFEELKREMDSVEQQLRRVSDLMNKRFPKPDSLQDAMKAMEFPLGLQAVKLMNQVVRKRPEKPALAIDLLLRIIRLEAGLRLVEERIQRKLPDATNRIVDLGDQLETLMAQRPQQVADPTHHIAEEYLLFFSDPPLLARDRRLYEPLKSAPAEFWPRTELTLIDMVPRYRDLSVPGVSDQRHGVKVCHELLKHLFGHRSQPVPWVLDRLAPNAGQDLIPQVPAMTDARKGGRLSPRHLRVRMLTAEMVEGLTKAFLEWPFRPSLIELELSASEVGSGEQEGGEVGGEEK